MHPIDRVREVLDERGWAQGNFMNRRGQVCISQAVHLACGCSGDSYDSNLAAEIRERLDETLYKVTGQRSLIGFNDSNSTNIEHIYALLNKTKLEWPIDS